MADILHDIQDKWIPQKIIRLSEDEVVSDITDKVLLGGDQLSEERAINVQKAFLAGDFDAEKLLGPDAKFEDWHAKVTIYEV